MRESRAYGNTIYMWLGTPLVSLTIFGLMVHRGLRKRALLEQEALFNLGEQQTESPGNIHGSPHDGGTA